MCRFELERGAGSKVKVLAHITPNMFAQGFDGPTEVVAALDVARANVLGAEAAAAGAALDAVLLQWMSFEVGAFWGAD